MRSGARFFTELRIARLLLAVMMANFALAGATPALAASIAWSGTHFGAGNFPPGCAGDMVQGTPEYWIVPGEGGLTGGDSSSQAVCHHMRTNMNYLDSPEVDVLILVPAAPDAEREMRQARQSMEMWEQGIDFVASQMGLQWLADGMNFHVTVDYVDLAGEGGGGEFTTYPIVDPEIVIVQGTNPVGTLGIGIDPLGADLCHGLENPFDIEAWEALPGFDSHHEDRGGIYNESCQDGGGGNTCFAVNTQFPSTFGPEDMFDLVSHEVGHCLSIGHVGDGAEGSWGGLPPDDIMAYSNGGPGTKCVSSLDVEGIALRMSSHLDVNGDGAVTAADRLLANDQIGQGSNPFQVQHPRDHFYASSTGAAVDCPQPDMAVLPGERTQWTPEVVEVQTSPVLTLTAPADGSETNDPTVVVTGSVAHEVDEVDNDPTDPHASYTDASDDATSSVTEILDADFLVTPTDVTATIHLEEVWPVAAGASGTSYSLNIGGRALDSFFYGTGTTPRIFDRGASAYLTNAQGTSTWDVEAAAVSFKISRAYLETQDITAPYYVASTANFGGVGTTTVDDRVPNGAANLGLASARVMTVGPSGVVVPMVGEYATTVTFDNGKTPANTFYTENSTAGAVGEPDTFTLDVAQSADIELTLEWTDGAGNTSDLDLAVTGAAEASSGEFNAIDVPVEAVSLANVKGRLDIVVDPYLITDPAFGAVYTLTAEVTPLQAAVDTDGDGFLDEDDACPNVAGPAGGCPDADGDGVADGDDVCPNLAGNGADGCPVASAEQVVVRVDGDVAGSQSVETTNGADDFAVSVDLAEGTHTLLVQWLDEGAVVASQTRTVTYTDIGVTAPVVSVTPDVVEEATSATLDVLLTLDKPASQDVVLTARTVDDTATAGADYTAVDTTVTIAAGQRTRTIQIPVLDDDVAESTEVVNLELAILTPGVTFSAGGTTFVAVNRITDVDDQPVPDSEVAVTTINGTDASGRHDLDLDQSVKIDGSANIPGSTGGGGGGGGGGNDGDVVADAGNSQHVAAGSLANLAGTAFQGVGPFDFLWSYDGDTSRFGDAAAMATTFDTTGLAAGAHEVVLEVTDRDTDTSDSDTVLVSVHNGGRQVLVDESGSVGPDFLALVGGDTEFPFTVAPGSVDLELTLEFTGTTGTEDLDLMVDDPSNAEDANQAGFTSNNPERISVAAPAAGSWKALVSGFISTVTSFDLLVTANVPAPDPRPIVELAPAFDFALGQAQVLTGVVAGGTNPVTLDWDLDGDGVPDASGATVTTTFAQGQHLVSLKATDAAGFEHRVVTAVRVGTTSGGDDPSLVVVAVTDTGINAYHDDFSADLFPDAEILRLTNNFTRHPSEYLAGYPASSQALDLTLDAGYFPAQDAATINGIQLGKLYWIPGTKIIGARDDGSASGTDTVKLLDEDGHGTASASVAVGNIYGFCPSCLLAVGEGFNATSGGVVENEEYFHAAKWVDITSNSFGAAANVGFGPLNTPTQPKASAEGGQIAMYAAGNGAANAFVVPIQTYLPASVGPDWIVRVGAAHAQSRQPILGDGNPVDISSFGAGTIPAAGISGTKAIGSHSGTSSATPKSAGALGLVLRAARAAMGDTTVGWGSGVVASGTPAGSGSLADGVLTRAELLEAFFKTTEHHANGSTVQFQVTVPSNPLQYLFEGYGLAEPASAARAIEVLLGERAMPVRTDEDTFFREFDEPIRDLLWGGYDEAADPDTGGESSFLSSGSAAAQAELLSILDGDDLTPLFDWWATNVGDLPKLATATTGGTAAGSVEVAVVDAGTEPTSGDWATAVDTSATGDWSSWTLSTTPAAVGAYDVFARVVATDGSELATDGPFTIHVNIPFDATCPVYNTRLGDDIAGDAIILDVAVPEASSPGVDVRGVDARTLPDGSVQWVLSVQDVAPTTVGGGERWTVEFKLGTDVFVLEAFRYATTPLTFRIARNGGTAVAIGGALDATSDTVRWTVPTTIFGGAHASALAKGKEVVFSAAGGWRWIGAGTLRADSMASNGCKFHVGQDVRVPALAGLADSSVAEDGSSVSLTVSLDRRAVDGETVLVSTTDGSATAGQDYAAVTDRVVTFADGATEATFTVDLLDDADFEGDEQFVVSLAAGHDTAIGATSVATVTIVEDDAPPTLSATEAAVDEAEGATLGVVLTLDAPAVGDVQVHATTIDLGGVDDATAGLDYTAVDGTFTIASGADTVTITIPVLDDDEMEDLEYVNLDLQVLGLNAAFADGGATARVVNQIADPADQVLPTVTISGGTVDEPAVGGTASLAFTVEVAGDVRNPVVVDLELAGGTASAADHDGTLSANQLVFDAAGSQTVTVGVFGDDEVEGDETVLVRIAEGSAANAEVVSERTATGTIVDTTVPALPVASVADVAVVEGDGGQETAIFVISLDRPAAAAIELTASTTAGTATDGEDFVGRKDVRVLVAKGASQAQFHVAVESDRKVEDDEAFTVTLSAPVNATIGDGQATGTILDDDNVRASVKGFSIGEDVAAAMGPIRVDVTLDQAAVRTVRVWVETSDGGKKDAATAGQDYDAVGQWVTFAPGQRVATFVVAVHDDTVTEPVETFTISLVPGEGVELKRGQALVTITDND